MPITLRSSPLPSPDHATFDSSLPMTTVHPNQHDCSEAESPRSISANLTRTRRQPRARSGMGLWGGGRTSGTVKQKTGQCLLCYVLSGWGDPEHPSFSFSNSTVPSRFRPRPHLFQPSPRRLAHPSDLTTNPDRRLADSDLTGHTGGPCLRRESGLLRSPGRTRQKAGEIKIFCDNRSISGPQASSRYLSANGNEFAVTETLHPTAKPEHEHFLAKI